MGVRLSSSAERFKLDWRWIVVLWLFASVLQVVYLGWLPPAPVLGDEVIINDPAATLAEGHGLRAASFAGDYVHLDRLFAHFPPVYELLQALAFRVFGFSAYSLRLTTTVMSLAGVLVMLLLLRWLWRIGWLNAPSAFAAGLLYATCAPLILVERTARMESTITVLAVGALWVLLGQWHRRGARAAYGSSALLGICLGLCLATHPEAVVIVGFLLPAILLSPVRVSAKLLTAVCTGVVPALVWGLTFRSQSIAAIRQFLVILHHVPVDPTLMQVVLHHNVLPPTVALLVDMVAALALVAALGPLVRPRAPATSATSLRLRAALAVGAAIMLLAMTTFLRASPRRYESMLAPLLVVVFLVWVGRARWGTWGWTAVAVVVFLQLATMGVYLHIMLRNRAGDDPRRFQTLVAELPPGSYVAADNHLWLELRQQHHPFTVIYPEYDGRATWSAGGRNPWTGFDGVILNGDDPLVSPAMLQDLAGLHWAVRRYQIAGGTFLVYLRPGTAARP